MNPVGEHISNCDDVFSVWWTKEIYGVFFIAILSSVLAPHFDDIDKQNDELNAQERAYLDPASPHGQLLRTHEVGRCENDDNIEAKSQLEELVGELLKVTLSNHLEPNDAWDALERDQAEIKHIGLRWDVKFVIVIE